jgi:RND family efflux transporter MFP subunit
MRSGKARAALAIGAVAALVLLLLWMQGAIGHRKVAPGVVPLPAAPAAPGAAVAVERRTVEEHREWPGTVRSRVEVEVAPKVMGRILEMRADVGTNVTGGAVLARVDDRDLRARVEQARSALAAAEAQAREAASHLVRIRGLRAENAAAEHDLESAEARAKASAAEEARARDALGEADVLLGEATLRAPIDGVVVERRAEAGDMAVPGRTVLVLIDPSRLRLEATVPESCATQASVGATVRVRVDALGAEVEGRIDEVAPAADPGSRTFLVKASLPPGAGIRPGMFGRFLQPCGAHEALVVPRAAVSRVGQLETVLVRDAVSGEARPRHVKTGKPVGAREVEVLSGLAAGEVVVVPEVAR